MTDEDMQILIELRDRLPIDQFNLEVENSQQPALFDEVGHWVSGIKAAARTAKEHIEYVKADLFSRIRKDPESFDLSGKIVNDAVNSKVITHQEYQEAVKDWIDADKLATEASILLSSVEQRKSLIGNLVQLFIRAYYHNEKPVNSDNWRSDEEAIVALRNQKLQESSDNPEEI